MRIETKDRVVVSENTNGIVVSVEVQYQVIYSKPNEGHYVFAYFVTIKNESPRTVQLLRRHWIIAEEDGIEREVEGPGVIGETPVLEPGDIHQYESGCPLRTHHGRMWGTYLMQSLPDETEFRVKIPEFKMDVPGMFR